MPQILLAGRPFFYVQKGAGPDIILLSGLGADHAVWAGVTQALQKHFRVTLFDNRGAGQSDKPAGPYSLAGMAADLKALMDELGIQQADVIGHSMGGAIAQQFVVSWPERVRRLGLICTPAFGSVLGQMRHQVLVGMKREGVAPELVAKMLMPWLVASSYLEKPRRVATLVERFKLNPQPVDAFEAQAQALVSFDFRMQLRGIQQPSLVLAGAEDRSTLVADAKTLADALPNSDWVVLPGCGHLPYVEKPLEFNEALKRFLLA